MWLIDKLFNRKIEGESSLDKLEPLTEVADELLEIGKNGADRVQPSALVGLTHSFNELDQALQDLVNDAIAEAGNGVVCSQSQWHAIKGLLDKSLYLNYQGISMIKCTSDGLYTYVFGDIAVNYGYRIEIYYDITNTRLFMEYQEL